MICQERTKSLNQVRYYNTESDDSRILLFQWSYLFRLLFPIPWKQKTEEYVGFTNFTLIESLGLNEGLMEVVKHTYSTFEILRPIESEYAIQEETRRLLESEAKV
jgi:hypothetical protein